MKKNRICKKILYCLICILLFIGVGFGINQNFFHTDFQPGIPEHYEERVYITKYGECYHSKNCFYLQQSCEAIGKDEARKKGYRACSYCNGLSNGYFYYPGSPMKEEKNEYLPSFAISAIMFLTPTIFIIFYKKDDEESEEVMSNEDSDEIEDI